MACPTDKISKSLFKTIMASLLDLPAGRKGLTYDEITAVVQLGGKTKCSKEDVIELLKLLKPYVAHNRISAGYVVSVKPSALPRLKALYGLEPPKPKKKKSTRPSHLPVFRPPSKMHDFCEYWFRHKVSLEQDHALFKEAEEKAKAFGLTEDPESLTPKRIGKLFVLFDKLWFSGALGKYLMDCKYTFAFGTSPREKGVAGVCHTDTWKKHFRINLVKMVIYDSKKWRDSRHATYLASGRPCSDPVRCMLYVFAHELVHLIVAVFCQVRESAHGPTWKKLAKHIFRMTSAHHTIGYAEEHEIEKTKRKLKDKKKGFELGDEVRWASGVGDETVKGYILRRGPKRATVVKRGDDDRRAWFYVPYSMLTKTGLRTTLTDKDKQ